jgi:two-component system sensor histidine kinase UhpB
MKPNLLIVDDIKVNLSLLEAILKKTEVNLVKASSGFEALEKAGALDLALAILDVRMPEMDGYELAVRLNERRTDNKVPVIFLTANRVDELELFGGYDSGAVDYIIKPYDPQILISKVKVFLDIYQQRLIILENARLLKETGEKLAVANEALKRSEEKYRSYIDHAPYGVIVTDQGGNFLEVNESASKITGYSTDELLKMSFPEINQDGATNDTTELFNQIPSRSERIFLHKNGSERWWSNETVQLNERQFLYFTQDITDRKQAEQELRQSLAQLHQLTQHIEEVRENERVVIARELHDDLGQALTAVKIDLGIIKQRITEPGLLSKVDQVSELVRNTIFTVQRLTSELRPQIIDDLGLEAAIEWYSNDFAQRNQLTAVCHLDPEINSFSASTSLTIFRIIQESLTNVSRYAKAKRVEIELIQSEDQVYLSITDDGIGISESEINSKKSFGIIGMKERTGSLGGKFEISKRKEKGTLVRISFPKVKIIANENSGL